MKIVLAPVGTRGDVQPLLHLGLCLQQRGHQITLCAADEFRPWIGSAGLRFVPMGSDFTSLMSGVEDAADGGTRLMLKLRREIPQQFSALEQACRTADLLVGATLQFAGPSVAERRGIPYAYVVFWPNLLPWRKHGIIGLPWEAPEWINCALWSVQKAIWSLYFLEVVNRARQQWGLTPVRDMLEYFAGSGLRLLAFDPLLGLAPPLSGSHAVTGSWFPPSSGHLPTAVEKFLADGSRPIYFGFGSMKNRHPRKLLKFFLSVAEAAGVRAILHAGPVPCAPPPLPAWACLVENVPHALLFPRLRGVVHHGGAGTTAAAALAGVPQMVIPHFGDQFYWGLRVHRLGLGPRPVFRLLLRRAPLIAAIRELHQESYVRKAGIFSQHLITDGLEKAASLLEEYGNREKPGRK